jgi:hypothetical protein
MSESQSPSETRTRRVRPTIEIPITRSESFSDSDSFSETSGFSDEFVEEQAFSPTEYDGPFYDGIVIAMLVLIGITAVIVLVTCVAIFRECWKDLRQVDLPQSDPPESEEVE